MSRGEGLLQRKILRLVERAARRGDGPLTRRDLENRLCQQEGFRSDNVLRAIRGLARSGRVEYMERRFPSNCLIRPPKPFVPFTDAEIGAMLEESGWSTGINPGEAAAAQNTIPRVSEYNLHRG